MIFVTVGTQLPFERLIKSMDMWAKENASIEVFAQIGDTEYMPEFMGYTSSIGPVEYQSYIDRANIVVSHVGMGTVITGLESGKQLVLMPRLHALGEHRNDHQLGSAERFGHFDGVQIVHDAEELNFALDKVVAEGAGGAGSVELKASDNLINVLRTFAG